MLTKGRWETRFTKSGDAGSSWEHVEDDDESDGVAVKIYINIDIDIM